MRKAPEERIARAEQFAARLREARESAGTPSAGTPAAATHRRTFTRFVALPLRILKPDPETDFLAFSVPDAVSVALAALESVVVRSAQAGVPADADVRTIGRNLSVDVVLTGTILRSGGHVRVSAQLADAAAGTIMWADVAQAPIEDLFQLQDTLTERIVSSLSLPLTARDRRSLDRHAPASAEAYELYLRANELATDQARWREARDLYRRSVEIDPEYAPAWARLGRAERVLGKWAAPGDVGLLAKAEAAFRRAFALDPDLSITHDLAAYADAESGRAAEAMERLLERAARKPNDTGVLAGLVTTCRYAGVLDGSKAAHQRVMAIVPTQVTSVCWTHMMLGDYAAAIRLDKGSPPYCALLSKLMLRELDIDAMRQMERDAPSQGVRLAVGAYRSTFEHKIDEALRILDDLAALGFADPEGWYLYAFCLAINGAEGPALEYVQRAVDGGFVCHEPLITQPEWTRLTDPRYRSLVERTAAMALSKPRALRSGGWAIDLVGAGPLVLPRLGLAEQLSPPSLPPGSVVAV
jgi:TolB-like protein